MSAVGMARRFTRRCEKGSPRELPFAWWPGGAAPSRHLHATRRTRNLPRVEAARAYLHLRDLAVDQGANDLQVRLPRAARLVVRVRDVVAERDALLSVVAAIALDGHDYLPSGMNSMRAISAPSPLRKPVFR